MSSYENREPQKISARDHNETTEFLFSKPLIFYEEKKPNAPAEATEQGSRFQRAKRRK